MNFAPRIKHIKDGIAVLRGQPWMYAALLFLVTLLGAALRFYKLGEWSFWIDEIYTINHAMSHFSTPAQILDNIPPERNWVPLSVILTAQVLSILGTDEWSARIVSAVIGVLSIPILSVPVRKIYGNEVALIALLLLAVSPWHIFWSQNARFYTSLMLLCTLALFSFFHAIEHDRPVYLIFFYALLYLASSERITALLIVPVVLVYVLGLWRLRIAKPRGFSRRTILFLLLPLILIALIEAGRSTLIGSSVTEIVWDTFAGQLNTTPLRLTLSIIYRIGVPVFILGFFGGIYVLTTKQRASLFVFISASLPILVLIFLSIFMFTVDRYIFMTLFPWLILGALAMTEMFSFAKKFAVLLPIGVLMILLLGSISETYLYYHFQNGNRPKWSEAYKYVGRNLDDGDIVYTTGRELGDYYLPQADNRNINSFDPAELPENEDVSYWFMIDESIGEVKPGIYSWIQEYSTLLRIEDVFLPGKSMSINIYRYSPDPQSMSR